MADRISELLDRRIPDHLTTHDLDPVVAAEIDHLAGRHEAWTGREGPPGVRARALVTAGRYDEARRILEDDHLDLSAAGSQDQFAATWAASRVGNVAVIEELGRAWSENQTHFVFENEVPLGPASLPCGLIAAARGDLETAERELSAAVDVGDARAPVWGSRARLELTRVLLDRAVLGDPRAGEKAHRLLVSARTFFDAGGYYHLARSARSLMESPASGSVAAPGLGHLFSEGGRWSIGYGVQPPVTVPSSVGLIVLRHLARQQGSTVLAVQLADVMDGGTGSVPHLDGVDIDSMSEAELKKMVFDERARSRVTKTIKRTVARLAETHRLLAALLENRLSTGNRCRFEDQPPVIWRL